MPTIDHYAPGAFCWFELAATDPAAAKHFYMSLFGWAVNDFPMGPNGSYSMFDLEGQSIAAAYTMVPEQREKGVPSHWMLYVSTPSADKTAARAAELGAKIVLAPFDVYSFGRMAVFSDPTRAHFSIWEPQQHIGAGLAAVDGTVCWADLNTPDIETAVKFYSALFGWEISGGDDPSGYLHIKNNGQPIGGVTPAAMRNPQAPPHWMLYFLVSDCDASAARALQLGATFLLPPLTVEHVGRMAIVKDPQGAVFALFQPEKR
ncbi:MAG: VOC family protein [Acidobacteriaceae bacterium]|nr:VOC family protein [Acidobacteriaceae bacterium]